MKASELLVSSVNITEDEYCYKGTFILSGNDKSLYMDMAELEDTRKIEDIKSMFGLEESTDAVNKTIMDMILEKAAISSRINEGESYN